MASIKENIFLHLWLNKSKYEVDEPITGIINISNNNSFDIIINNHQYQDIFGCFFEFRTIKGNTHFEASIENLVQYRINAKSSLKINFSLNKFGEIVSENRKIYYSNLIPGKYSISAYIYGYDHPDYKLEFRDINKVFSNKKIFEILKDIPDEIANISININLLKSVYNINESINGSINISNNNLFTIELEKNILHQRLTGEHFKIDSIDTFNQYRAFINEIKYPIEVKAKNYLIIYFEINKIYKLPLYSKNITYTHLKAGNYSIFAYFYYNNSTKFVNLISNNITFRVIDNSSGPRTKTLQADPPPGKKIINSAGLFVFYSSIGILVIIILLTTIFIAGTEIGKYGFFSAIAPLYTKRRKKKDENYGYNKGLIQGYIDGNPGESYNAIKRSLRLKNGTLAYYLKVLQKDNIIRSERDGMYKRFYPTKGNVTKEVIELSTIQKKICQFIKENPGSSQMDISKKLGIIHSKVNYNVNLLVNARLIKLKRDGNKSKCFIIEEV